jgi:hypothetical protein
MLLKNKFLLPAGSGEKAPVVKGLPVGLAAPCHSFPIHITSGIIFQTANEKTGCFSFVPANQKALLVNYRINSESILEIFLFNR